MTRAKVAVVIDDNGEMKREKLPQYMAKQNNTYYVRVPVPKPLWPFYPSRSILRSLQTTDFVRAKIRLAIEVGKIKAEFEKLANADPFAAVAAEQGEATEFAKLALQIMLEDDPTRKAALIKRQQAYLERLRDEVATFKDELQSGQAAFVQPRAEMLHDDELQAAIKDADGLFGGDEAVAAFKLHELAEMASGKNLSAIARAQILEAIPDILVPKYLRPYLSLKKSNNVPSGNNVTLEQLVERFYDNLGKKGRNPGTKRNYVGTVDVLLDVLGKNMPVRSITRDAILAVQDVILHLPPNTSRKPEYKGKSYVKIAENAKKKLAAGEDIERLASKTRNKYLRNIGTIFKFALDEMMIDANPAMNLQVHLPEDQDEEYREPFDADDLKALFPRTYRLEGLNWMPLIMLYGALRPNEAAQLDVADIIEVDGVWCIDVSRETKGQTGAARWDNKSTKNDKASERRVPIHQKLIELGFLDYYKTRIGQAKLFEVKRYGEAGHFISIQREFYAWMDAAKVRTRLKVPHSFRHTWRTQAFQQMERRDFTQIIGGWSLGSGTDVQTYLHTTRLNMRALKADLDRIQFDIFTTDSADDRRHDGLIGTKRPRRAARTPARKLRSKRALVPGKERPSRP